MKIKAVISCILATLLCLMMLPVSAFAGTMGDVDANGKVDATDARLALRASVGLDTLSEEATKAADVNFDGTVNATDARLILRAAVGLETLPEPETPEEPETPDEHTHEFRTISLTGETKCSVDGCDTKLPAFNTIVNGLKDSGGELNYFTGVFEDIAHYDEPEIGGTLAGMMEGEDMAASTEITYSPLVVDRLVTKNNFHSKGADFVSDLAERDVKSIKIEKVSTVDFVSSLPEKFNSGKYEYDLSAVKAYKFPEVYKITLVLPSQSVDITKPVTGTSVYDKIYTADYNATLEKMRNEVSSGFDSLTKDMAGLEGMLKMKNSGSIKTSLTVEYYVTVDTFKPVAAEYAHAFDITFDVRVTDAVGVIKYITMLQKINMASNSYYFFNNNFSM